MLSVEGENGSMPGNNTLCLLLVLISCPTCAQQTCIFGLLKVVFLQPLAVQWLRLRAPSGRGTGLTPGRGTKIPHKKVVFLPC